MRSWQTQSLSSLPKTEHRPSQGASLLLLSAALLAGLLQLQAKASAAGAKQKTLLPSPQLSGPRPQSLSQTYRAQKRSARQRSSNRALEIDAATYADVKPHAASGSRGRRADLGRQVAQAVQAHGPGPAQDGEFGDLLRDAQQCIIIAGGNSAKQKHGCVPCLA